MLSALLPLHLGCLERRPAVWSEDAPPVCSFITPRSFLLLPFIKITLRGNEQVFLRALAENLRNWIILQRTTAEDCLQGLEIKCSNKTRKTKDH